MKTRLFSLRRASCCEILFGPFLVMSCRPWSWRHVALSTVVDALVYRFRSTTSFGTPFMFSELQNAGIQSSFDEHAPLGAPAQNLYSPEQGRSSLVRRVVCGRELVSSGPILYCCSCLGVTLYNFILHPLLISLE